MGNKHRLMQIKFLVYFGHWHILFEYVLYLLFVDPDFYIAKSLKINAV